MRCVHRSAPRWIATALGLALTGFGCEKSAKETAPPPAPMVTVAAPAEREVTQYEYAQGRVEAVESLQVRARVSGNIVKIHFTPGTEIDAGARLIDIDPEPFKAELAKAKGELAKATADIPAAEAAVARAEAQQVRARADLQRSDNMLRTNAISQEEHDKFKADFLQAQATVKSNQAQVEANKALAEAAKAKVRSAELDLEFCTIKSPIAGKVGDRLVTEGNLIAGGTGNTTLLTTVVSLDPIYIAYDIDENTCQRVLKAEREGRIKNLRKAGDIPTEGAIAIHGKSYPLKGVTSFVNNQVDPKTGTIRMKAIFTNPKNDHGTRELVPGMFANVRIPLGDPRKAMLVPDSAVLSDQGTPYILVVGDGNKATRYDIEPGPIEDGMRVVERVRPADSKDWQAMKPDAKVIVTGLQRVRPGMVVDPKTAAQ